MSVAQRFRKRPVEVEALQVILGRTTKRNIIDFCPIANVGAPEPDMDSADLRWIVIETLEGQMTVTDGDYIIRGVKGEFYPCKPDIFALTYEPLTPSPWPPFDRH